MLEFLLPSTDLRDVCSPRGRAGPHSSRGGLAGCVEAGTSLSSHRRHERDMRIHLSLVLPTALRNMQRRKKSALFVLLCPNGFTKMSLCERERCVSRWSAAAVNHLDLLYVNICLFCGASVCIFGGECKNEDYPHILCLYREPEDLLLSIYASYKCIFALKGTWGIKKGGGTSLNSPFNAPQHRARNDGVKPRKEVLLRF